MCYVSGVKLLAPLVFCLLCYVPSVARAALWEDATAATIGNTGQWSNKVELADVDGDGLTDILFANGGKYAGPGPPQLNRVFANQGADKPFIEITADIFGDAADLARSIKVGDVNADGQPDLIVATTYQTQSRLFHGLGDGAFLERTATHVPEQVASAGDVELGDVDGDGDLDAVLADWGAGNPLSNGGGRTLLWLNSGTGRYVDATEGNMPDVKVGFSWDLELVDVDADYDLDVLVSCKSCGGSKLFLNDGSGVFSDASDQLPQFGNNYEFEPMDINGDGALDLVTINDGPGLDEHLFINDGSGTFTVGEWAPGANVGKDDNAVVFLDYDSDGDADFLIGSLSGQDRLLINDGTGALTLQQTDVFDGPATPGTLGIAVADLNGDHKLDVVQSQGEVASPDVVFLGKDIAPDTASPIIGMVGAVAVKEPAGVLVRARVHDNKSPTRGTDWTSVRVEYGDGLEGAADMVWYGEYLWRAELPAAEGDLSYRVCATDRAGNSACSEALTLTRPEPPADEPPQQPEPPPPVADDPPEDTDSAEPAPDSDADAGSGAPKPTAPITLDADDGGCSAGSGRAVGAGWLLLFAIALWTRRRVRVS